MAKRNHTRPPCPDPERYIWVQYKNGTGTWRARRGTYKEATLNEALAANANNMRVAMPAAIEILDKLAPYTERFAKDRRAQRLSAALIRGLAKSSQLGYECLADFDMQKKYPLETVLFRPFKTSTDKDIFSFEIDLSTCPVKQKNNVVTDYYFDLVLLSGLPGKNSSLRTENDLSAYYPFGKHAGKSVCTLSLQLPAGKPYVLFLKAGCRERGLPASHSKNYGMKVVAWG